MKLRFKTKEEIPDKYRDKAVQDGEEWVVDVEGILNKNTELLDENKKFKDLKKKVEGLDVEAARRALVEIQTLEEERSKVEGRVQSALAEQATKHGDEVKKLNDKLSAITTEYEQTLIRAELQPVMSAQKGTPELLMPALQGRLKVATVNGRRVVQILDDKGNPALDDKGQPLSASAFVETLKKDPIFSRAFEAPTAGGSGAAPGGSGGGQGGGAGGSFQLTETQARDRATYVRVAAEAAKAGQSISIIPG